MSSVDAFKLQGLWEENMGAVLMKALHVLSAMFTVGKNGHAQIDMHHLQSMYVFGHLNTGIFFCI